MYLFTRVVHLAGPPAQTVPWATEMRDHAASVTGRDIALWAALFGAPVGSFAYTMRVSGLADLDAVGQTLAGDAEYHAKLAAGAALAGAPAEDSLARPLHGELGDPPPVGAVATVTSASMAGRYVDAVTWGIEVALHVESVTGTPVMLLSNEFGPFGGVTWIGVSADAAAADAAADAVNADSAYIAKLEAADGLFIPGSGHRSLLTRVA
jgi:hypothetical protein